MGQTGRKEKAAGSREDGHGCWGNLITELKGLGY